MHKPILNLNLNLSLNLSLILGLSLLLAGCSIPSVATKSELYSFTKKEKVTKGGFGSKKKQVEVKDFRLTEMYEEDITALKEEVEKYIAANPQIDEAVKANLKGLKVAAGENEEQVKLLLGDPDTSSWRIDKDGALLDTWVYALNKWRSFTIFLLPVFIVRESYTLHFKNKTLATIELHYLKQIVHQASGAGIN